MFYNIKIHTSKQSYVCQIGRTYTILGLKVSKVNKANIHVELMV